MTNSKVVTARHGTNIHRGDDPRLTAVGVWESFVLGYHLRFKARLWNPVILTSPKRRCSWTAGIVRMWFPEIWLQSKQFKYIKELFVSAFADEEVSEEHYQKIVSQITKVAGDIIIITHHQLSGGMLLSKLAMELDIPTTAYLNEKLTAGGAHLLNCESGEIMQLCGAWILPDIDNLAIVRHRDNDKDKG